MSLKCKFCGKLYEVTESWKSTKFCSKTCRGKYSNIGRVNSSKLHLLEMRKRIAENPKLHPRDLGGNYGVAMDIICRRNPLRPFFHKQFNDDIKKSVVRRYIDNRNIISSLVYLSETYGTTGLMVNFLRFIVNNFPHICKELIKLYDTMSTWETAKLFKIDQRCICRIYGKYGLNVTSRSMKCSKIHLQTKPIIEEILGVKTETEHPISRYHIDEFSEELKLCVEIDGEWCHNKEYDKKRDEELLSLGYKTVRIPAYSSRDKIEELLSPYKKFR